MLQVLFFGRIREELACARLTVELDDHNQDLDGLQEQLVKEHGARWADVLGQENLIRAVNQDVATANIRLKAGDEVAFFPPVTGG